MSVWNCRECDLSLLEAPPGTAEEGNGRPAHLEGALSCTTQCGHLMHVECIMKLEANAEGARQCPACHQDVHLEETIPLRITTPPTAAPSTRDAPSSIHRGSGDASTESSPSNSGGIGGNPSGARTASEAFGPRNDSSASPKRARGEPNPPPTPPPYMELIFMACPEMRPYFTPEMNGRLNAHIERVLAHLRDTGRLESIQTHLETFQERWAAASERTRNLTRQEKIQLLLDTAANTFLNTEPQSFTDIAELFDEGIQALTQWIEDNL